MELKNVKAFSLKKKKTCRFLVVNLHIINELVGDNNTVISVKSNFISVSIFNTAFVLKKKKLVLVLYKLLNFIMQVSIQKQLDSNQN